MEKARNQSIFNNYIHRSRLPSKSRTVVRWELNSRMAIVARVQLSPEIQCSPISRGRTSRRPAPSLLCRAILTFLNHRSQQP